MSPKATTGADATARPRVLHLTLKRRWFDMIVRGEKKEEYRRPGPWILSRLKGKAYDVVEFRNGYGPAAPVVRCEYLGWEIDFGRLEWGGGFDKVAVIRLGSVIGHPSGLEAPVRKDIAERQRMGAMPCCAPSDPYEDNKSNPEHLTDCDDDGCDRCRHLLDGFYMACDHCGHWGQQESDGWTLCRGMTFCNERCRDAYFGCDASSFSETEPIHSPHNSHAESQHPDR